VVDFLRDGPRFLRLQDGGHIDPRIGRILARRYRPLRLVAADADVVDYEGENVRIGKRVLIRMPALDADLDRTAARLAEEARVAGAIESPHVAEMIDVDRTEDGVPLVVRELAIGPSLAELTRPLEPWRALSIGAEMAAGVRALHAVRVHGALSPEHFVATPSGLKLVDLGLGPAREPAEGLAPFRAPDATGSPADDVYAIGAILRWLVGGAPPPRLEPILERCTRPDPAARFGTIAELELALSRLRDATPAPGGPAAARGTDESDGFRLPRDDLHFELADVFSVIRPDAAVKGLFLQKVVDRLPDRAALFARAGVPDRRIVPFLDVPYHDYFRVLVAAGQILHPDLSPAQALRRLHLPHYQLFAETLAGRVIFGVLGNDAAQVMPLGPRGWQVNLKNMGEVTAQTLGSRHVRYVFAGYPALLAEICDVGVVQGALAFLGEQGTVRIRTPRPDHAELDIAW
jgi:uncharacterized protein (TIGR02265 family)